MTEPGNEAAYEMKSGTNLESNIARLCNASNTHNGEQAGQRAIIANRAFAHLHWLHTLNLLSGISMLRNKRGIDECRQRASENNTGLQSRADFLQEAQPHLVDSVAAAPPPATAPATVPLLSTPLEADAEAAPAAPTDAAGPAVLTAAAGFFEAATTAFSSGTSTTGRQQGSSQTGKTTSSNRAEHTCRHIVRFQHSQNAARKRRWLLAASAFGL
jgi:hypothetical protein